MVGTNKHEEGIGFLDLDMRLVYEIMHFFEEEYPQHHWIGLTDLVYVFRKKGYGKHKIVKTVNKMVDCKILSKIKKSKSSKSIFGGKRPRKNTWSWVYMLRDWGRPLYKSLKQVLNPQLESPSYFDIKREHDAEKGGYEVQKPG